MSAKYSIGQNVKNTVALPGTENGAAITVPAGTPGAIQSYQDDLGTIPIYVVQFLNLNGFDQLAVARENELQPLSSAGLSKAMKAVRSMP